MRAELTKDADGGLGIPYGFEDERRFWNLRRFPKLVDGIPELRDDPALYDFVKRVNGPGSRFATLGCERWTKVIEVKDHWVNRLRGTYVDVCLDRMELLSRDSYVALQRALAERGGALRSEDESSDFTLIELEPQKVSFNALGIGGWVGTFWILGYGDSDEMVMHYRNRGLAELADLLEAESKSLTQRYGLDGTTIFERLSDNGGALQMRKGEWMLWDTPGVPHKGWTCIGVDDIRDGGEIAVDEAYYEDCQMCGHEQIRFVHNMVHDEYPDTLRVGCVCAGKMENPYAAMAREKVARNRAARKAKWLSRTWRVSAKGNDYLNVDGHNIGTHQNRTGQWSWRIGGEFSRRTFPTEDQAKLALFDECWARFWATSA